MLWRSLGFDEKAQELHRDRFSSVFELFRQSVLWVFVGGRGCYPPGPTMAPSHDADVVCMLSHSLDLALADCADEAMDAPKQRPDVVCQQE